MAGLREGRVKENLNPMARIWDFLMSEVETIREVFCLFVFFMFLCTHSSAQGSLLVELRGPYIVLSQLNWGEPHAKQVP